MKAVTYVKDALSPGGTPKRYLIWVSVVLALQVMASILPSAAFREEFNLAHIILICGLLISLLANIFKTDHQKIIAAYVLYIVGLLISTITISLEITPLSGIVFMLTWAMTLFVAERREYISFDLVTLFMVMMLISTVTLLISNPAMDNGDQGIILITGALLTAINIYLVYIDFGQEKNFYQESRKTYADLEALSFKMSEILSSQGKLEHLLWQVAQECVPLIDLEECVIYLYNRDQNRLIQASAFGNKTSDSMEIINPISLIPGQGIVGKCFESGKYILVEETRNNPDYIVDDAERNSELAVPIISNGKVMGVIDSEHQQNGFFKERHVQSFQIMASFLGIKITEYYARESIEQAKIAKEEVIRYKELDELKNRFITNISHDLKTPLSLIKAPAMQIAQLSQNEQIKNHSNYILKNTEHLLRVVNQLLQLNRVDKGLNELYIEEIKLDHLIGKVASQYQGLIEKDQITFRHQSDKITLMSDSFRLEQILHNLVHNAFRYAGKNAEVSLEAIQNGEFLKITISDNGPGIAQEIQHKVFERFFKADVNNHEGTGIGLSLVQEYSKSLGGSVDLQSEIGKGTKFIINIPLSLSDSKQTEEWLEAEAGLSGKPIMLVVEDHADLNNFICNFFEEKFQCISAFDGNEALDKMKQQIPDIIISDLMMPRMSGNQFVQYVKSSEDYGHIPVIILSAKSQTESRIDLYSSGADNYLIKPFDINELDAVVLNTLEQRKKIREKFNSSFLHNESPQIAILNEDEEAKDDSNLLNKVVNYVIQNLDNPEINIKTMSEDLGIGRNRFQKEIKEITGMTAVELVRSVRLNEAKKILSNSTLNISEVAYSVGFNNLSYFTRSFKSEFGILPSELPKSSIK